MTLIEVKTNEGRVIGRCDAKCYDANGGGGRCNCVCEGLNHGVGIEAALQNGPRIREEWQDLFEGFQVRMAQVQLRLFEL